MTLTLISIIVSFPKVVISRGGRRGGGGEEGEGRERSCPRVPLEGSPQDQTEREKEENQQQEGQPTTTTKPQHHH